MEIQFSHDQEDVHTEVAPRSRVWKKTLLFFIAFVLFFGMSSLLVLRRIGDVTNESAFSVVRGFILSNDIPLEGEKDDRINILLLGMGGIGHDGGYLTDTIIVASIKPSTGDVALLSLPRDMSVPIGGGVWQKVNSINAHAEAAEPSAGGDKIRTTLEQLFEISIPYYVRVDFEGFKKLVDAVSGVTVTVDNLLDDPHYPVLGNEDVYPYEDRFEHLVIKKGKRHMDGDLALKYARSRYGSGGEGSDFARIKRQQNILVALKEKLLSWPTLANPIRLNRILASIEGHIDTNIPLTQLIRFANLSRTIDQSNVQRATLSDAPDGMLVSRIIEGAYILIPRYGNYTEIRQLAQRLFSDAPPLLVNEDVERKTYAVEILNGTNVVGLAQRIALLLEQQGFDVVRVGNAPERGTEEKTKLYNLHPGEAEEQERRIEQFLDALVQEQGPLPFVTEVSAAKQEPDFVIILGENARIPE